MRARCECALEYVHPLLVAACCPVGVKGGASQRQAGAVSREPDDMPRPGVGGMWA